MLASSINLSEANLSKPCPAAESGDSSTLCKCVPNACQKTVMCQAVSGSNGTYSAAIVTNNVLITLCVRTNCVQSQPCLQINSIKPSVD